MCGRLAERADSEGNQVFRIQSKFADNGNLDIKEFYSSKKIPPMCLICWSLDHESNSDPIELTCAIARGSLNWFLFMFHFTFLDIDDLPGINRALPYKDLKHSELQIHIRLAQEEKYYTLNLMINYVYLEKLYNLLTILPWLH